jgi:hypothetical protein
MKPEDPDTPKVATAAEVKNSRRFMKPPIRGAFSPIDTRLPITDRATLS